MQWRYKKLFLGILSFISSVKNIDLLDFFTVTSIKEAQHKTKRPPTRVVFSFVARGARFAPRTPQPLRGGGREWVSKRKHHGVVFSRRDTPQSKERGEVYLLHRSSTTMFSEGQ